MLILRLRCGIGQDALRQALEDLDAVAVRPGVVESVEEFELAHHLAKSAFGKRASIARSLRIEFLLWLAGKTDIKSAILESAPRKEDKGIFVVIFSGADAETACRKLDAVKLPLSLKKEGEPLALERISLSRVKN